MSGEIEIKFTKEELKNFINNLKEINIRSDVFTYDSRILISRFQMALEIYENEEHNEMLKERIAMKICDD
jgi:endo-1,4-beta-mannosidase